MDADYIRTLFDYSYWARDKLLVAMDGISRDDFERNVGLTYGGVGGILRHCVGVERLYRTGTLQGRRDMEPLDEAKLSTSEGLAQAWREEEALMREYLAGLTGDGMEAEVRLTRRDGSELVFRRWQLLSHLANHGTQHRSEAAEALTMLGRSPGNLDLLFYFIDKQITA